MSIIFAWAVGLFLAFLPTAMVLYYKSKGSTAFIIFLLNLFGFATLGITSLIAFIFAVGDVGLKATLKSIGFAIFLIVVSCLFIAGEFALVLNVLNG